LPQINILFIGFCAVVVPVYWLIPDGWRRAFLSLTSTAFLLYMDPISFALLFTLTGAVFFFSRNYKSDRIDLAVIMLLFSTICVIRFTQLIQRLQGEIHLLALVGFGFYALKLTHYFIEQRSGSFRKHRFIDFYSYMLFFPTIMVGPIHKFDEFLQSNRRIRWNDQTFADGLERILYGYAKVVVIANWLIAIKIPTFAAGLHSQYPASSVIVDSAVYGFHLYFAFAGLSDIAIGLSRLLGYQMCENFDYPFLSRNIGEFWQSWHMSLSSWCRQYIFIPFFAKSRNLPVALLLTMICIGLWHEFSIRYLLWGIYHASGILLWRWYQKHLRPVLPLPNGRIWQGIGNGFSVAFTFSFVILGFTIPRSSSFKEIINNFQIMISG